MVQLLLFPVPAMASLNPSRMRSFPVEVKTAAPTHTAVMCADASEGRLRRPCEGTLFDGKEVKFSDDLVDSEQTRGKRLHLRRRDGSNLTIRRCMSIPHDLEAKVAVNQSRPVAYYL
jgi:hypothetical protein